MIKQTLERIEKLIKDKTYQLPEILSKLYALLLHFAKKIEQKNSELAGLHIYADALKLFRNFLVEEPFKLTKITTLELNLAFQSESFEHFSEIFNFRDCFIKELGAFIPTDAFGKRAFSDMTDFKWAKKMKKSLEESETLKKQFQKKKGTTLSISEITVMLWFKDIKGESIIHIDRFVQLFLAFIKEYFPALDFLDNSSLGSLRELCDPDRKYFVTVSTCDEIFLKLRNPEILERLWMKNQQKCKQNAFVSQSSIVLRLTSSDNSINQIIGITGQRILEGQGQQKNVKDPPVVIVGSSLQCDIVLKNKYISRKQMAIIEDKKSEKQKETSVEKYNFSIICLSQSNFTIISYPQKIKAQVGLLFFGKSVKYQILACEKIEQQKSIQIDDDNKTLSILPSDNNKNGKGIKSGEKITFLILSGDDKGNQVNFSISNWQLSNSKNEHLSNLKQMLEEDEGFYLKPFTKILCKTSNQILEGRLSRKIRLRKDMKIFLDQFTLSVE